MHATTPGASAVPVPRALTLALTYYAVCLGTWRELVGCLATTDRFYLGSAEGAFLVSDVANVHAAILAVEEPLQRVLEYARAFPRPSFLGPVDAGELPELRELPELFELVALRELPELVEPAA